MEPGEGVERGYLGNEKEVKEAFIGPFHRVKHMKRSRWALSARSRECMEQDKGARELGGYLVYIVDARLSLPYYAAAPLIPRIIGVTLSSRVATVRS